MNIELQKNYETEEEIPKIELSTLIWKDCKNGYKDTLSADKISEMTFSQKDSSFKITATKEKENPKSGQELIRFYIDYNGEELYKGYINLENSENILKADWGIAKINKKEKQIKLGKKLVQSIQQYLQNKANEMQQNIVDEVQRSEDYPNPETGMDTKKWNAFFVPLLKELGYREKEEGLWEKTYKPQQQEASETDE